MGESRFKQRLEAILAADAAGFSRLMEKDEPATVAALEHARNIFREQTEAHQGHVINMAGDSVLAVFDTAAGAVNAALTIQRALDAAPADAGLRFRIGVHLGDVIENPDGDIHGDGVNIASRLQALAEPGGIVVSEAVRGAVKSRVAATFSDRGMQIVKNIADPIRAFAVRDDAKPERGAAFPRLSRIPRVIWFAGAAVVALAAVAIVTWVGHKSAPETTPVANGAATARPAASGKPSIAVLPFDNMSGDSQQAYFADGITEDLITDLSKVAGLVVIARNSTFQYKGKAKDVREIGKALNAAYVLEGSVRRNGEMVRVNAQLIDASSGAHVWADRYDGEMKNIFGLQDTITRNVVKALSVELTKDDSERVAKRGTGNAAAYDMFLKGWEHYLKQTPEEFRAAIADFKKAAELDPSYGRAYAALAALYWEAYTRYWGLALGFHRSQQPREEAEQYLAKAMREPTPLAHQVSSEILLNAKQYKEAIGEARQAVASEPNDPDGHIALAGALSFAGQPAEALEAVDRAMRLNPHYPSSYIYQRGLAQFGLNKLDDAAASLERALAMNRDDYWSQRLLLAVYGLQGRRDDAARLAGTMKTADRRGVAATFDPLTIRAVTYWYPFAKPEDAKRFAAGLAKAGVPD